MTSPKLGGETAERKGSISWPSIRPVVEAAEKRPLKKPLNQPGLFETGSNDMGLMADALLGLRTLTRGRSAKESAQISLRQLFGADCGFPVVPIVTVA